MQENTWINNQKDIPYQQQQQTECIRLFVTIRRDSETKSEYQKMTIMAPLNQKVSMLKRLIEREFSDLFPHEPTFICAKLEDEYGYSLSNASQIQELLKTSDRLFAIPETFSKDFIGKMHVTHDLNELTFMLKSITQTIIAKLAEADLGSPQTQLEILQLTVPIGFTLQQKAINHNTALTLKKIFESERLQFMEDPSFALITQLLVKLIQFWTNDLIFQDQFLLNITVDVLESLLKSATFANAFKTPQIINSLMSVSKVDFVSAQTRSRIIKLISYLSRPTFQNYYQPKPYDAPLEMPQTRMRRPPRTNELEERKEYVPSMIDQRRPLSNRRLDSQQSRTQQLPQSTAQYAGDFQQQQQYSQQQQQQLQLQQRNTLQQQQQQQYPNQVLSFNEQPQQQQYPNQAISFNQYDQARQQAALRKSTPIQQPSYQQQQFQQSRIQTPRQQFPMDPQQQVFDGLVQDYLNLISTESNEEMLQFAVQNLADGIETTINSIMDSPDAFKRVVNLLEIAMNPNFLGMQQRILEQIALNMNEARAKEGIKLRLVQRIMKAFTYQPKEFHNVLYDLLSATLKQSEFQADVLTVISMIESPYERISILGLKILALMSDPQRLNTTNLAMQFENYIKSLMEWTFDGQKGEEFQYNALMTLANLAINDYIRPQILHLKGIEFFLRVLRQSYRVDAQRLAAKALLNLSIKSRETKLSIVSELEDEIKRIQRGDIDTVVGGYLQTLMASRDRGQLL